MERSLCLSVDQMAERLGIGRVKAYELVRIRGFPAITVGRRILIPIAGLERWLEGQTGSRDAETRTASIDTADPVTIRKLDKLVIECPDVYRCISVDDQYQAKRYEVGSRYVRFGKPTTEAQREAGQRKARFLRESTSAR